MRVGVLCPYSLSVPGGVQGQVLGLARSLRAMGVDTRVLAPCDGPPPDTCVTPLGDSIPTATNGSVAPLAPDPAAALRTIRALRDEAFDVLHLHEPLAPGPTLTSLVVHPAPIVGTFHASGEIAAYRWFRSLARWVAERIDVRCAVSPDARATAERFIGGRFELLFNGIELDWYRLAEPIKSAVPAIVFLGRHEPRKGLGVLLEAMAFLPADVRLWVLGTGPQTAELQSRYAGDPRIEWLGQVSDVDKARYLAGASVACFPSLHGESFGVVLLEAMAAGTAVVASDLHGYRNVARPGREALMVEPGDPRALGAALLRVLTDPATAAALRAEGDARAEEFSMDALARRYVELYERARGIRPTVAVAR